MGGFFREAILMMELPRRHAASLKRAAGSHLGVSPAIVHRMRVRDARAGGLRPPHVFFQGRRSAAVSVDVHERNSSCRSAQRSPVLREKLRMATHWPVARALARSGSSLMMPVPGDGQTDVEGRPGRPGQSGRAPAGGAGGAPMAHPGQGQGPAGQATGADWPRGRLCQCGGARPMGRISAGHGAASLPRSLLTGSGRILQGARRFTSSQLARGIKGTGGRLVRSLAQLSKI